MKLGVFLALAVGSAVVSCRRGEDSETAPVPEVKVETGVVERATLPEVIEIVGRLRPIPGGSAVLSAPAPASVKSINGHVGSRVKIGARILALDAPDLRGNATQLAAAADLAAREATRVESLYRQGLVAKKELERATSALTSAKAAAEAAKALANRADVRSPLSGEIQRIWVQVGEHVETGAPLVDIENPDQLELAGSVPARSLTKVAVGQPAAVAAMDTVHHGTVHGVAPGVDTATGNGEIIISITNSARRLRPGVAASASITVGEARDVLTVPEGAIVILGGASTVFVVSSDSLAHARTVTLGTRSKGRVAVTGELAAGDVIVIVGAYGLADGTKVIPTAPGSEP